MKKFINLTMVCFVVAVVCYSVSLLNDRKCLDQQLIRLHVVANSNTEEDQNIKLKVRDRVLKYMETTMDESWGVEHAKEYLQGHLQNIQMVVNDFLAEQNSDDRATVSLGKQPFGIRDYDTFSLPSGVYESLKITIGNGEGINWWCVAFPRLCLPAVNSSFEDTAADAGLSEPLIPTLKQENGYEIRFFLLDIMGKIENFFFQIRN